ncbi:MAG: hydrogen gas-evolving membrane-bound hydrogenase subunit E [Saprospiraceae bacterium]
MLFAILAGFVFASVLSVLGSWVKDSGAKWVALLPASLFVYFAGFVPQAASGEPAMQVWRWSSSFGVDLAFRADGLGLLFALIITGIGALVFWYASYYLAGHRYLDRFYAYLSMFMGAMLGLVLSDNLITLFVFWELTSISSFFLIGFDNEQAESRKSALVALGVTGLGGLLLLGAAVLLGDYYGTYSLQKMLASELRIQDHSLLYPAALFMLFGAAFTKSAQFPAHFWLPGAMKAPTPVSTYLHSATMVKAGVYLLLRMTPLLGGHTYWQVTLLLTGGVTMLYAAVNVLLRNDMKSVLAYTTISALGVLVFLIGIGTPESLLAALVFVLAHALYKAPLFLVTGIVDHETGTRDLSRLSGLRRVMPLVALSGALAALSNSGFPPFWGFVGKDLIYEAALQREGPQGLLLMGAALLTSALLFWGGFVVGVRPFWGRMPESLSHAHAPPIVLWLPPLLLGVLGLALGLAPGLAEAPIIRPAMQALGLGDYVFHLKLWHGFNTVLGLSALTLALGGGLYLFLKPSAKAELRAERYTVYSPKGVMEQITLGFAGLAREITLRLQSGLLRYYILIILSFLIGLTGYRLLTEVRLYIDFSKVSELVGYEIAILAIMLIAIAFTVFTGSRLTAVAALGVVGYALCLLFVFYSAPDLAMTQFTIDTLTVILFVLILYRLPRYLTFSNIYTRSRDAVVSLLLGALIATLALEVLNESVRQETSAFYAENAYTLAKGKNVVNVILVDFRGADTLVEVSVLTIAAIGVFSLLKLKPTQD